MSSGSWWWPLNWPAPKGSEHLQKDYKTSTTTNTTRNLEEERLVGRIGVLTKRVEQLETQFHGLYDSCCDLMGRIKSLETQMLWHGPVEKTTGSKPLAGRCGASGTPTTPGPQRVSKSTCLATRSSWRSNSATAKRRFPDTP